MIAVKSHTYGLWHCYTVKHCSDNSFKPSDQIHDKCCAPYGPTVLSHYSDVILGAMAYQITGLTIVYSTVCSSGVDVRKHQSSASLAFMRGIYR